jgi:hypothetical protein
LLIKHIEKTVRVSGGLTVARVRVSVHKARQEDLVTEALDQLVVHLPTGKQGMFALSLLP